MYDVTLLHPICSEPILIQLIHLLNSFIGQINLSVFSAIFWNMF